MPRRKIGSRTLGKLIVKCHVKDFKLEPDGHGGDSFCNIRDGSVDWPAVRKALDDVGYNGWMTIEGGDLSPEGTQQTARLDHRGQIEVTFLFPCSAWEHDSPRRSASTIIRIDGYPMNL